jgi:Icc-related predicted phosphoesterase
MRFSLLTRAAENSVISTLKTLYNSPTPTTIDTSSNLPRVSMILVQLLKNEQKVLQMLAHISESQSIACTLKTVVTIEPNDTEKEKEEEKAVVTVSDSQ